MARQISEKPATDESVNGLRNVEHLGRRLDVQAKYFGPKKQQALWVDYVAACTIAQNTATALDEQLALAKWRDWLEAYIPNPNERLVVPFPKFGRAS